MVDVSKNEEKKGHVGQYIFRVITWIVAIGCFYLVYARIDAAAVREGQTAVTYLLEFFAGADWVLWLSVMIPYSMFFFLVDAHVTWPHEFRRRGKRSRSRSASERVRAFWRVLCSPHDATSPLVRPDLDRSRA